MKKYTLIISALLFSMGVLAQNSSDALRYSRMQYLGSARFNAMGGAFSALGGDISSIVTNPAAVGIYRSSEFTFTPNLYLNQLESSYRGSLTNESTNNFNIGNIGYVGSYKNDPNGWKYVSFAIGHNRISNFYGDYKFRGTANSDIGSSLIDGYVNVLNNNQSAVSEVEDYAYPFGPSQAYWTYMIDPVTSNSYKRHIQNTDKISQYESNYVMGKQSESFFSFGGNYQDRLFLGGNIGFQNIRYERERDYKETYIYTPVATPIDSVGIGYNEISKQYTNGSGANIKIGAIYKVSDEFRIAASIHSPTWLSFSEEYQFEANSTFSEGTTYSGEKIISTYEYQINTPWRYTAGLAYLFQNRAALSVDYEYVDYSTARIKDNRSFPYDYGMVNESIKTQLKGTHNFRVGAEINLAPFVVRGGFRYEDNPYSNKQSFNADESRKTFSVGTGFRSHNYTVDLTYMHSNMNIIDPVYNYNNENATIEQTDSRVMLTVGWRW